MTTTLAAMQAGSTAYKLVVLIEGVEYVLTDHNDTSAVQAALAGTDWESATVIPWLRVELRNEQSITPLDAFVPNMSRCLLRVADTDGQDTFGTFINRRLAGGETTLTATLDRDDTTISVKSTTGFPSSGTAFIGTEAFTYSGVTATSFTGCTRGKYSPFTCNSSGSGGSRFANHHRYGKDASYVQMQPVVSQFPRTWMGKRVGVWMHTLTGGSTLNTKADAQLLYAGRLVSIADDQNTFETVMEIEPFIEEVRQGVVGKDMWSATIAPGLDLKEGRVFSFEDWKYGNAVKSPSDLVVVSGAPANEYEMQAGTYSPEELCGALSAWLAAAKVDGDVYGLYRWASPVTSNVGLRTKCYWSIADGSGTIPCSWAITMPGEVAAFLGMTSDEPGETGQSETINTNGKANESRIRQGDKVPFTNLVFKPYGPGRIGQEFNTDSITYNAENERGTFIDQRALLPAPIKDNCVEGSDWGVFLLDEKVLMVGSYADGVLSNCWLAPVQLTADKDTSGLSYIGRRADEDEGGVVTLRQIFLFEAPFDVILKTLLYSTGTPDYNHDHDQLGYGLGLGLPGSLLGGDFERTLAGVSGHDAPIAVVIDEPTKIEDLFGADLKFRRAFFRWKDQGLEMCQWKTPILADSVATLSDANKFEPSGQRANHRSPTMEAQITQRPIVKIDYCRDFAVGRDGQYLKSVQLEDQTTVDDMAGNCKPETLKMRNTYPQFTNTGSALEALIPEFMAFMPCVSRPWRALSRSIGLTHFEGLAPGDIVTINDTFARDPVTGHRQISSRPAVITRHWYDLGGSNADGSTRQMAGGVDVMFLDAHRGETYAPSANVDSTYSSGGFTAGYDGVDTLYTESHAYSHDVNYDTKRGTESDTESIDAANFAAGDKILIIERDPASAAAPDYWERTIDSVSGNEITLTTGLSSPAFSSSKKYLITYQKYSQVQSSQEDYAFQADDADYEVEGDPFYHYSTRTQDTGYVGYTPADAELVSDLASGDGRPRTPAHDKAIANTLNMFIDYKSAHQAPFLNGDSVLLSVFSEWRVWSVMPVFLGTEILNNSVHRFLKVAPWFFSGDGSSVSVRVTLTASLPTVRSGAVPNDNQSDFQYTSAFSQATWTTSSTTPSTGSDKYLRISKSMAYGVAYLILEINSDKCGLYGLAECIEGERNVVVIADLLG